MKKLILNCFLAICLMPLVISCGDDEATASGSFTFNGTKYKLAKSFVTLQDVEVNGDNTWYEWQIILTSNGIKLDDDDDFTGTGDAVIFYVYALNDDGILPEGTYTYNGETAYCDGIYIDFSPATETGDEFSLTNEEITIEISKSGSTYTIEVTGVELEALFKGKIKLFEPQL